MGTFLTKHYRVVFTCALPLFFLSLLVGVRQSMAPPEYRINAAAPSRVTYSDFQIIHGQNAADISPDGLSFDSRDNDMNLFVAWIKLSDLERLSVQFSVNCPEQYQGTMLYMDLYGGETYDAAEQDFSVELKPGINRVDAVLDKGKDAPEKAWLRFFVLEPAEFLIQDLSISGMERIHSGKAAEIIALVLLVLMVVLAVVVLCQAKRKTGRDRPKKSKSKIAALSRITVLVLFIAVLLAASLIWIRNTYGYMTLDMLVIQLSLSLKGVSWTYVSSYFLRAFLPAAAAAALAFVLLARLRGKHIYRAILSCTAAASLLLAVITVGIAWKHFGAGEYLSGNYSDFVDENYVDPANVALRFPEKKRNLIYIYLESMETTYSEMEKGGGFPYDCIPELSEIARQNEDFSGDLSELNGAHALSGATWTVGAMVAHMSGLPMKLSLGNNMSADGAFFPSLINLGDILEANGYRNEFLLGSDAKFGGRSSYFSMHGNYDIHDLLYAYEIGRLPSDYHVWWGYEDEKLYAYAKEELLELAAEGQPFNYVILTVDTHSQDGYVCGLCEERFPENQYANVVACASRQAGAFLDWVQEQAFYEDTTVVVVGDHLTMDSDFCAGVAETYDRKVYTAYINAAAEATGARRVYSTMDLFPTTLAALGVEIPGERLGLGTNLFSSAETLCERHGLQYVNDELKKRSNLIEKLQSVDPRALVEPMSVVKDLDAEGRLELRMSGISLEDELTVTVTSDGKVKETFTRPAYGGNVSLNVDLPETASPEQRIRVDLTLADSGDRRLLRSVCHNPSLGKELNEYLKKLKKSGWDILIAGRDEASSGLDAESISALRELGCQLIGDLAFWDSYCAVISADGRVIVEDYGQRELKYDGMLPDGSSYQISSAGYPFGNSAVIKINDVQYALNTRGLNIVAYDPVSGRVMDCSTFDTCRKYTSKSELEQTDESGSAVLRVRTQSEEPSQNVVIRIENEDSGGETSYTAVRQDDGSYTAAFIPPDEEGRSELSVYILDENGYLYLAEQHTADNWDALADVLSPWNYLPVMTCTDAEMKGADDIITIREGNRMYGPFLAASAGDYILEVSADIEPEDTAPLDVFIDYGETTLYTFALQNGMNRFPLTLTEDTDNLEFSVGGKTGEEIQITRLHFYPSEVEH